MQRPNVFLLCFAVVAVSVSSIEGYRIADIFEEGCDQTTLCTFMYEPVCGSDGKTYGNECFLSRCQGVTLVHKGECRLDDDQVSDDGCDQTKICSLLDEPVCGSDGKTYGNDCELSRCPGVRLIHEGECKPEGQQFLDDQICSLDDAPVCGSDGKTYGNQCELSRSPGVTAVHDGECQPDEWLTANPGCDPTIICSLMDEPVCGSDGKTYGNDCMLSRCPGVTVVHDGECQAKARNVNRKVHEPIKRHDFDFLAILFDLLSLSGKF